MNKVLPFFLKLKIPKVIETKIIKRDGSELKNEIKTLE